MKQQKNQPSKKKISPLSIFRTSEDLKTAALVVSLTINMFVLCLWVALQLTSRYDSALISFFIHRG